MLPSIHRWKIHSRNAVLGGFDARQREAFHWQVCQRLGPSRHFPKPVLEEFREAKQKLQEQMAAANTHRRKKSIVEMLEHYRPQPQRSNAQLSNRTRRGRQVSSLPRAGKSPKSDRLVSAAGRLQHGSIRKVGQNGRSGKKQTSRRSRGRKSGPAAAASDGSDDGGDAESRRRAQNNALEMLIEDRVPPKQKGPAPSAQQSGVTTGEACPPAHQRRKSDRFNWLRQPTAQLGSRASNGTVNFVAASATLSYHVLDQKIPSSDPSRSPSPPLITSTKGVANAASLRLHVSRRSREFAEASALSQLTNAAVGQGDFDFSLRTGAARSPPSSAQRVRSPVSPNQLRPVSPRSRVHLRNSIDFGVGAGSGSAEASGHSRSKTAVMVPPPDGFFAGAAASTNTRRAQSMLPRQLSRSPIRTPGAELSNSIQLHSSSRSTSPTAQAAPAGSDVVSIKKSLGGGGAEPRPHFWSPQTLGGSLHQRQQSVTVSAEAAAKGVDTPRDVANATSFAKPAKAEPVDVSLSEGGNVISWLGRFQHEQALFASPHVFAQIKLDEARQMLDVGDVAPRAKTSLLAFLLCELEELLISRGEAALFTATYVVFSMFHAENSKMPRQKLVPAAQVMMGIGDPTDANLHVILSTLSDCNSERELVLYLRRRLDEEMALRPRLEAALRNARRIKLLEQKTVNRMTVRNLVGLRRRVFHKWQAAVIARRRLRAIGLQLFAKQRAALLRGYIKNWRLAVDDSLLKKQQEYALKMRNAIKRAKLLKDQTAKTIREVTNNLQELQESLCVNSFSSVCMFTALLQP